MKPITPDSQLVNFWFMLVVLGLILSVVGWLRWAS